MIETQTTLVEALLTDTKSELIRMANGIMWQISSREIAEWIISQNTDAQNKSLADSYGISHAQ